MKNYTYDYKETSKSCTLSIHFHYDRMKECNQDEIFNKLLVCIKVIANKASLTNEDVRNINKFLSFARHSNTLDIKTYLQ